MIRNMYFSGLVSVQGECRPLLACGRQIGAIRPDVAKCLLNYPQVFIPSPDAFTLNPQLDSYNKRSNAIDLVLQDLRTKNVLVALRGWRDECFNVWADFGVEPLFKMERSGVTLLGVRVFGVHIMGYTRSSEDGRVKTIWVQKRSIDKPTYPGMMDTMVGGGITAGLPPFQVMLKEAHEEAAISESLAKTACPAGTVSFFTETERGLHANTEFVYDLELPSDFVPCNNDGEVEGFEAVPVEDYLECVTSLKYKLTSVPVAVDFLVRHGFITPESEPQYAALIELLHVPLDQMYHRWPQTTS
ncbi:Nudix hydrolase 20,-like [Homarus americanus]|uniref:Nudix hydrolase 20,-like n=1 Tax=Homarus americanus TaxID=6706 RepID=A0A8J5JIY3_HOMAM|nr:Nudix hydrolase 20,-like [Homarus americanus]